MLRICGPRALVELELETGRTHQIRVHMAHLGCPLTGDFPRGALCQADGGVHNAGGGGGCAVADGQVHPAEAPGVEGWRTASPWTGRG